MAKIDPLNAIKSLVQDRKNPNRQLEALKYAAAQARLPFDRDVWLNVAFYLDEQYVQWNAETASLQPIKRTARSQNAPRPVANKMMHFASQSHAFALQDRPTVDVLPATDDPIDLGNTGIAKSYLTYFSEPQVADFDSKLSTAVLWAIVGGEGWLKWVFNDRLKRPDVLAVSPLDIYPDPYAADWACARYAIHSQFMDVEQVYEIYGVEVKPSSISTVDPIRADIMRQMGAAPVLSGVDVNELWMKPCRRYPQGLYAVWSSHETLVAPGPFPYAHKELPFTQLGVIPRPGSLHYASPLKYMRSGQMELNKYHQQKIMTREAFANPKWWIPQELELESPPDDSPNQILTGVATNGMKPEIIQPAVMPDNRDGDWIRQELMDIVGLHEVSNAQVPGRVEAAKAIEMLKESDVSRLSVLNQTVKTSISDGYWQVLQLARQYVSDDVIVQTYSREGLPEVKHFKTDVIKPGMRVRVTMGTGLARSRAAREDQVVLYWQNGIITDPDLVAQLLDMPAPSFNPSNAFDMRLARNENMQLADGVAIKPNSWDNHDIHLREHNNWRKTHEYLVSTQDVKNKFEQHCSDHDKLQVEEMGKQLQKLQLAAQIAQAQQQTGQDPQQAPPAAGGEAAGATAGGAQRFAPQGPEPGWQVRQQQGAA